MRHCCLTTFSGLTICALVAKIWPDKVLQWCPDAEFLAIFCITGHESPKVYIYCTSPGDGQTSCKVRLASVGRRCCSNKAKTQHQLKLAGVPQTNQTISAASRPKFTILWGYVGEILLFNKFFVQLSICTLVAKI